MAQALLSKTGTKTTKNVSLSKAIFEEDIKSHELLKQAYDSYLANGRINLAKTKTRGLISGGGKKPWKQKGTGRARFGSSRNPIWRGGGIVFGPTGEENYAKKLNVKAKHKAIRQALTLASKDNKLIFIEALENSNGKTAEMAKLLTKIQATGKVLIVVQTKTDEIVRSSNNLSNVKLVSAKYLNVFDLLNADKIVLTNDSVKEIETWLVKEDSVTPEVKKELKPKVSVKASAAKEQK